MIRMPRKYFLHCLVLLMLLDITYSHDNDTSTEGHRLGRVSGRIVKLYSGPKPDPILCTNEGFLADVVDCSVFYRCIKTNNGKYTVYRFQCGPGTIYDPDTEICNHPRSTKRLHCGGLSSDKLISSTETYIENEIDGLNKENHELPSPISTKPPKSTIKTPKPVKFESSHITAPYPWISSSNYVNAEITTISTASPWNMPAATTSKKPWEYTQTTYIVTRQPNIQSGAQCTSDGFMGDNEDCRKFYRCVNNQRGGYLRYEFSCSESTIWDDDAQGCNHPWAVQRRRCGKGNSYDENSIGFTEQIKNNEITPNNIIQHQTQISYGSKVTQIQTQISTGPATQNQTQINFGDRLNTGQSPTQLSYGAPASQSQAQLSYGNEITPAHSQVQNSNNFSETQTPISDIILSSTTTSNSNLSNKGIHRNKCTTEGFMGDSDDCQKFYRCIGNEKRGFTLYEFSCTEGTVWDEQLEACNHAWAVKECGGKKSNQNISSDIAITESTTLKYYTTMSSSLYGNEIDENSYPNQNNQQESKPSSTATQTTVAPTTVATDSSRPYETTDCTSNGFFGNVQDCTKFYRCVENSGGKFTKYEYKCGDGTVWDPEIESCNHAWSVKSCGTNRINSTEKENIAVSSDVDNAIVTTVSLMQTTTQKNIIDHDYDSGYQIAHSEAPLPITTTTERIANHGDVCQTSGFMGDTDCKKFYRCVENGHGGYTRHEFTCGEGTVWDPDIEACNHAWAVKTCGGISMPDNSITSLPSQDNSDKDNGYNKDPEHNKDPENTIKTTTPSSTTNFIMPVTNNGNNCRSDGFMGNDNDCKIFYRCVENGNGSFLRYEFSCGDGTVWDPKISACNHAWAVEKCGGSNSVHESSSPIVEQPNYTTTSVSSETSTQYTTLSSSSTILTPTASDSDNQCMANGFIGDKKDCKKFYRCVEDGTGSYIRYEFTCGEGTVWDSKIQACNHARAVDSCENNTPSDSGSTSTSRPTTMKDEEVNSSPDTQNTQGISSSTENIIWSSSTMISSTKIDDNEECKTEGFIGDSNDCKKFYRCVNDGKGNFIRYQFSCGDGTVWDSEINACNHVNSVKTPCNFMTTRNPDEKEPNYTVSSSPSEVSDYSTTSQKPTVSQHCEQEGFVGDKSDCKKFYRCTDNGQGGFHKYEFTCGEGTIWDQENLACIHGSPNSHCGSMNREPQTNNSNVHSTTTPTEILQSTEKTQTSSIKNVCTSEGFYANSDDCKKFFRCVGDGKGGFTKYDFTCGEGTIWVQDIQACDHDTDTSLCSTSAIVTGTTSAPSHSSQEKPTSSVGTSTAKSTTMDLPTSAPSTKPILGDETETASSTSGTSSTASTSTSDTNQDRCEEAGFFGNSQNCKMFYRCVDDGNAGFTKYDFTCGDGTIWDQDITACNHPQDVSNPSCKNEENTGSTTKTTTTKSTTTTTTTVSNETQEPTKGTSTTESTTTENNNQSTQDGSTNKPSSNNYTCTEAGFFADPYDCKKFYRCVDWGGDGKTFSIYHFDCGEGTIWDPNLKTCNHEESVYPPRDCSGSQSQNEISNNTTTTAKQEETTESSTTERSTTTTQPSTTTDMSSTTDQTTTQQSSTSEPTSTTQQSTTQTSTTEQSTTQTSTTEQSTTQKSTTTEQTTSEPSTQQSTTEQSTTQKSTTEKSTTQESTEQTTTQQSSTTTQSTTSGQTTSTTSEQTTTTTTEQTTTTSNEDTTTTSTHTTTSESTTSATDQTTSATDQTTSAIDQTTSATDQTTKAEPATTQESTEQSSESQLTTEQSTTQETTDGSSTTESGQDTTTEQESSNNECPQTDDDQYVFVCPTGFKRHPKYCNLFYQCTEDDDSHEMKVAVFHCPNNTIYDESKTQCVEEQKADKKCDGQIAQRRRVKRLDANYKEPITVDKGKNLCPGVGHFPFEQNEQCSPVLFKCDLSKSGKLRGFIYQCPNGYAYWSISRRCEPVSIMAECKRSLSTWSGRYEIPIERNNVGRKTMK